MTANKITYRLFRPGRRCLGLMFLPALWITSAALGDEVLVVGPREPLRLASPEDGTGIEAAIGGGVLAPVTEPVVAPQSGDHWMAVASRDLAGNLSTIRWVRLRVDETAPHVDLQTEPTAVDRDGRRWIPPNTTATAESSDALAGLERLFLAVGNDVEEATASELRATLPGTGAVRLRSWAVDRVGNRSSEVSVELTIDDVAPSGEISVIGPRSVDERHFDVLASVSRIDVEPLDTDSGMETWFVHIDGEAASTEALAGPWTAGPHSVEIVATDRVGNEGRIGPFQFVVDGEAPEIHWRVSSSGSRNDAGELFYRPPVELAVHASDAPAGLEILEHSSDGDLFEPLSGPISIDDDHVLLRATDRVGNRQDVRAQWRVDAEPPSLHLETPAGERIESGGRVTLRQGDVVAVRVSDLGSGIASSSYAINERAWRFWRRGWWPGDRQPLPPEITLQRSGRIVLLVESVDRLGHRSTAEWQIDVRGDEEGS